MHKRISSLLAFSLLLFAFVDSRSSLQAQDAPYLGTTWTYTEPINTGWGTPVRRYEYSHIVLRDTVRINGVMYYELEREPSGCESILTNYLRYSADGMQIYYWSEKDSAEFILYDFSLAPGDTLRMYCNNSNPSQGEGYQTILIDSVVAATDKNNNAISYQYTSILNAEEDGVHTSGFHEILIGVGSTYYLFPFPSLCDVRDIRDLRCYEDGEQRVKLVDHDCEAIINSINESEAVETRWIESIQEGVLRFTKPLRGNIAVTNLQGKQVYQKELQGEPSLQLPASQWEAGVYILQVQNAQGAVQQVKYRVDE